MVMCSMLTLSWQIKSGLEIQVTLWGQRATQFTVEDVYNDADPKAVVVLFVGCLMKNFQGDDYLSGSSACKWYFNPDIPEAAEYYDRYGDQRIEIRRVVPVPAQPAQPQFPLQQETRYLRDLLNIGPYEFPQGGCRCTVTIARLVAGVSWWFPSCSKCAKACSRDANGYTCYNCNSNNYRYKYKLVFMASDGTAEAEMICFGQIAQRIIGKPVDQVLRTVRRDEEFPLDVAGIVAQKHTFTVTVANQSFYTRNMLFMINSIVASYGRQRAIPHLAASSSARQLTHSTVSAMTGSSTNSANSTMPYTPPAALEHHATPHSPVSTQTLAKDAPPVDAVDTPESRTARKRLTYDLSEDEQESGDEHHRRSKLPKVKATAETSEKQPAIDLPPKRAFPDHTKASGEKSTELRTSRSQKNK
ncbi:unnamed protein product [Urochloa humidicola]